MERLKFSFSHKIGYLGFFLLLIMPRSFANPLCQEAGWFGAFGVTGYHYQYTEKDQNDIFFMKDTGPLYGFYYGFGYQPECIDLRFAVDGYYSAGKMNYTSSRTGSAKGQDKYTVFEIRLAGYYPWHINSEVTLEGYAGLGGRYLDDDSYDTITTTGHLVIGELPNIVIFPSVFVQ